MKNQPRYHFGAVRERVRRSPLGLRWAVYSLLLLLAAVGQTCPGFLVFGGARPGFILPLCLAVSLLEPPFWGAVFGAAGGLLWDLTAARPCGWLGLAVFGLCLLCGYVLRPRRQVSGMGFYRLTLLTALVLFSADFLFFYWMPEYGGAARQYLTVTLPCILFTALFAPPVYLLAGWVQRRLSPQ